MPPAVTQTRPSLVLDPDPGVRTRAATVAGVAFAGLASVLGRLGRPLRRLKPMLRAGQARRERELWLERELQAARMELTRLAQLAGTDALTGLANRRRLDEALGKQWRQGLRQHDALAVLMIDVDHFKPYNDQYGHAQGDRCLQAIAQAVAGAMYRPGDLAARYGGEEFAVVLPGADLRGAVEIGNRIRAAVAALELPHRANAPGHVTVSIGAAWVMPTPFMTAADLLAAADDALYAAKRDGRDGVVAASAVAGCNVVALPIRREAP